MRICPQCGKQYESEMNYCLEDGSQLYSDQDKTIPFGLNTERITNQVGGRTNNLDEPPTAIYRPKKSSFGLIILSLSAVFIIFAGVAVYGLISMLAAYGERANSDAAPTPRPTPFQTPSSLNRILNARKTDKLKVEVLGNVKGGFNQTFIKCRLTNQGEGVIKDPSAKLTLYKNDLKIGDVFEKAKIDYLKPDQSVIVWVNLFKDKADYTAARPVEDAQFGIIEKDANLLYPSLVYTETKMTSRALTSSYNFRPFKEIFYEVKGTVENRDYDNINADIYVIFYDANSEIVGIASTSPPQLKRGEKAEFEASMGEKSLFGVPVKFELIAIDDSKTD